MVLIQVVSGVPHPTSPVTESVQGLLGVSLSDVLDMSQTSFEELSQRILNGLHVPAFGFLTWLWCWASGPWTRSRRGRFGLALGLCVPFSLLNELSQLRVADRYATVPDALANLMGVGLGVLVFVVMERIVHWPGRNSSS